MDDIGFDSLIRSLATPTRRSLLAALATALATALGGIGGASDGDAALAKRAHRVDAERRKRKKKKRGFKSTSPSSPPPPPCTPECADKECGPNGCGGSCGDCSGGMCQVNNQCANGSLAVGEQCDPALPRACGSGVCGCVGQACTCRNGDECLATGNHRCSEQAECCTGPCAGGALTGKMCRKADCGDPQSAAPCQVDADCCAGLCINQVCTN